MRLHPAGKSGFEEYIFDVMRLLDIVLLIAGAYCAYYFRFGNLGLNSLNYYGVFLSISLYLFVSHALNVYNLKNFRSKITQMGLVTSVLSITFLCHIFLLFIMKDGEDISRQWLLYWFVISYFSIILTHIMFIRWFKVQRAKGLFIRRIVIYGESERARTLIRQFEGRRDIKILAAYVEGKEKSYSFEGLPILNETDDLREYCLENDVDDVILTVNMNNMKKSEELLSRLSALPCNISYCFPPAFFGKYMPSMPFTTAPVVTIFHRALVGRKIWLKRMEDIILGSIVLVMISPVLLIIALMMILSGERNIIFKQQRGGFNGELFTMYKFRSMREHKETGVIKQAQKDDDRVTKIGAILRRTSLDELPQIINVVKGDMSLVGPRPHALSHDDYYGNLITCYAARHKMKPGITGWAQVNGWRGETETLDKMENRVRYDMYYIENWSLWLDLKILFLTFAVFLPSTQKDVY